MSRLAHLLTAFALTCALVAVIVVACGAPPLAPREMPPLAPRPERVDPTAVPVPTLTDPAEPPSDAAKPVAPTSSAAISLSWQLASATEPVQRASDAGTSPPDASGAADAGGGATDAPRPVPPPTTPSPPPPADASVDAYTPPLPPIPDANLPADSRLEPIRLRD